MDAEVRKDGEKYTSMQKSQVWRFIYDLNIT